MLKRRITYLLFGKDHLIAAMASSLFINNEGGSDFNSWLKSLSDDYRKLTSSQRLTVLSTLATLCSPSELYEYSNYMSDLLRRDFLSLLPAELVDHVLSFIDHTSLLQACLVSKRWNEVISGNDRLWKQISRQHGFVFLPSKPSITEPCSDCTAKPSPSSVCLQHNTYENCPCTDCITKPSSSSDCLQHSTSNNCPVPCDDCEVHDPLSSCKVMFLKHKKSFNRFSSGKLLTSIIAGHSSRITAIDYHNGYIATGGDDRCVHIWNSDNQQCIRVIYVGCTVAALNLRCTHVAIASFNASAILCHLSSGIIVCRFIGHTSAVFSVDFNLVLDVLVTGSADRTVILWSLANQTPLHSIQTTFKPLSVHFVLPPEIPSDVFVLVASDCGQCETWLVNKSTCSNIMVSDVRLPQLTVNGIMQFVSVGADVYHNRNLILAWRNSTSTEVLEQCVSFKCSDSVAKSNMKNSSSYSADELETLLDVSFRSLALSGDRRMQLLGTGSQFSAYVCQHYGNNELIIVRHNLCSRSEIVGVWHLPHDCRRLSHRVLAVIGDQRWLNGFDPAVVTDRVIAAYVCNDNTVALCKF